MQLILIIAKEEYASQFFSLLAKHGYYATMIGCNGEFLQYGDTIYLLGVEKNKVEDVLDLLKNAESCQKDNENIEENKAKIYVLPTFGYVKTQEKG